MKDNTLRKPKLAALTVAISLATALASSSVLAVDFHGYVRSGIHETNDGGQQSWLAGKVGRFGNETDGWWDMAFSQDLYKDSESGKSFGVFALLEGDTPLEGMDDWSSGDTWGGNGHLGLSAYYISAKGYIAAAPEATLWVGKRSPLIHEIQMLDWKAVKQAGNGFGVDDIKVGPGLLSFDILRNDAPSSTWNTYSAQNQYDSNGELLNTVYNQTSNSTKYNVDYFDIRYSKLPFISDSTVELIGQYSLVNKSDEQKQLESAGTIQKAQNSFIPTVKITKPIGKGFNETYLQYTTKRFANNLVALGYNDTLNTSFNDDYSNAKAYRLINDGEMYLADNVIMAHAFVYAHGTDITPTLEKSTAYSAVARPAYLWNQNNKTAFEMGWFKQTNTVSGQDLVESGKKATLAQIISVGPSLLTVRPEIRFYTTYLKVDKNQIDNWSFRGDKDHQLSFGVQAEAWW